MEHDKELESLRNDLPLSDRTALRPWVRPALERLSLNDALTNGSFNVDGGGTGS